MSDEFRPCSECTTPNACRMEQFCEREKIMDAVSPKNNTMLQDALVQTGIAVHKYSGRGMMGKECLAISGEIDNCREALGEALIAMIEEFKQICLFHSHIEAGEEQENINEVIRQMFRWNQDTMGYGVVLYWPEIPYDTSEDQ